MQIIANRDALSEAIAVAGGVVASRTPKQILQCVKLSATKESLLMTATDLEVGIRYVVRQVEVLEPGEVVIPASKLSEIVRESSDETLQMQSDAERCHIRGSDSHFQVYVQEPRDFPPVAELEGSPDIRIPARLLRKLIEQTLYSAAKENTRYAINGVFWEHKANRLQLIATDGRRLAKAGGDVEKGAGEDGSVIVPAKTMSILMRLLHDDETPVSIKFLPNQLVLVCGAATVSSVLVEGSFPQYEQVIPRDNDKKIELGTQDFHSAVRRAALLTSEQSKGIRLAFGDGALVLSSRAPEQGEAQVKMKTDYRDAAIEIGFNPTFLTDALKVMETPTFTLELKESNRPGILRLGQDFVYVIMPVSLS